ncbi:MAG: UDP-N-acetylmuramate dehydrogenase [Oscillospiraceae bacterium]|nr:UDP-N-acetylmuramate dehydrogenase [Oscillospiraceae bacterium]
MANLTVFQQEIFGKLPEIQKKFNEPMAKHTSFRIGGPAEVMLFPKNTEELAQILKVSAIMDCKTAILGAGTNILAPDDGISGLVICLKDAMDGMELLPGDRIRVAAGVTMARCAVFAAKHSLQGMEFAHGIPGTVGGGVYMNAGAYGGEMCQIVESVDVMSPEGTVKTLSCEEMDFSYRHSRLEEERGIVVSAVLHLAPGEESTIREKMQDLMNRRRTSQPLDLPSAGSAFKRPVSGYAAALIDQAGLKGFRIGDAAVSEKHAGFVVNLGNATAAQVRELLDRVSGLVAEASGIRLEPEVRIW